MAVMTAHNADASRYEIFDDGRLVGVAEYVLTDATALFPHTEITPPRRGEGLGARLVRYALDDQRAAGHRVVPRCWYVAEFIDEHPEYADLVTY
jgi:predicted GNAT family acetyltransferase